MSPISRSGGTINRPQPIAPIDSARPAPEEQRHQPLRQGEKTGGVGVNVHKRSGLAGLVALHPRGTRLQFMQGPNSSLRPALGARSDTPDKVLGHPVGDHIGRGAGRVAFLPDCLEAVRESGQAACGPR